MYETSSFLLQPEHQDQSVEPRRSWNGAQFSERSLHAPLRTCIIEPRTVSVLWFKISGARKNDV